MNRLYLLVFTIAIALFLVSGCGQTTSVDDRHDNDDGDTHASHNDVDTQHQDNNNDGDHDDHDDHQGEAEEFIQLEQSQLSEFGIEIATAKAGTLSNTVSLTGEIVLNPDRVAHVVARASGIGKEVYRTIGDNVEIGEILAILESPDLAESKAQYLGKASQALLAKTDLNRAESIHANTIQLLELVAEDPDADALRRGISGLDIGLNRGELVIAYADLQAAEAIYDREKKLYAQENTSESEYLQAESDLKKTLAVFQAVRDDLTFANKRELESARRSYVVANVSLKAAELRLHAMGLDEDEVKAVEDESDSKLARYEIRSPMTGRIIERHLVRGESLESGQQVFIVADLSSVWGELTLYQRDLAVVSEGQTVSVIGTHDLSRTDVIIKYISPILDEQTRTTIARVVIDNTNGKWRPGMFIRAELVASEENASVVIPRSALQEIDGETVVFVQTEQGIQRRDVQIGRRDSDFVEIIAGINPGEKYVAKGGLALKAELNKAALQHAGHAH